MANAVSGTVLIVEDESELRFILQAHLQAAGFRTLEASDGTQGAEIAAAEQPDVIIMDVGLPGLSGIATTQALKADKRTASIPIIMLTARAGAEDVVRGLEAGAQEYVAKPFDMMELLARVQTVYRLGAAQKSLDRLNAQLEAEVGAKTRKLQLLFEFMRDVNRATSRNDILDHIVHFVEQMTGAKRISLLLRDQSGEHLVCERAVGIDPSVVENMRIKAIEGIAGQVFRSGKTVAAKAFGVGASDTHEYDREAFISTPLIATSLETPGGIIGVLNVTEKRDDVPFLKEEIDAIRSVANAGAIALANVMRSEQLERSVGVLLRTVGHLAEYRDEETTHHLSRVSMMARIMATELAREGPYAHTITKDFIESLVQAAPMHDIGKVGIPDEILTKPGKLTDEEFQIMKTHTDIGRRVLSQALDPAHPVPLLQMCIEIAYCHHERYDGKGYPRRIAADDIPLPARIIALVDAYDAITSKRRYKEAKSHQDAVEIIRTNSDKHFDPVIVEAFLRCHDRFDKVRYKFDDSEEIAADLATKR